MFSSRQYDKAEAELARGMRKQPIERNSHIGCPTQFQIHEFLSGGSTTEEASIILAHIGRCSDCANVVQQAGNRKISRKGMLLVLSAVAATILITIGSQFLHRPASYAKAATIDLRGLSPTRGTETSAPEVTISRSIREMRFILPIGSEGHYDSALSDAATGKVEWTASGEAVIKKAEVILELPARLETLPAGLYKLVLQRGTSHSYYLIELI